MKLADRIRRMKIEGTADNWTCLCGNTGLADGFYPCDSEGQMVEPTPEEWATNWYVCNRCGRIIDRKTMEVKGVRFNNTLSTDELVELYPNG